MGSVTASFDDSGIGNETNSSSSSKKDGNLVTDTSPDSQAVASDSKSSEDYRYLAVRPRRASKHDANSRESHSQHSPNPEKAIPLTQRTVVATCKNPWTNQEIKYIYTEYESTNTIPVTGFDCQRAPEHIELPASKPNEPLEPWKIFPPPPNSAFTELERIKREYNPQKHDSFDMALDGAELAIKNASSPKSPAAVGATYTRRRLSTGDMVATGISFTQKAWVDFEPSAAGEIYNRHEQKEDFVRNLDEGAQIEYCKKCKQRHIAPGSPLTLSERDTCGAYLPDWFPTEGVHKPWTNFIEMINHWIILNEIQQGYNHRENPERQLWNLEFHDNHGKWKQIGRVKGQGGWWKCRTGPNATYAERSCRICTSKDAIHRDNEVRDQKDKPTVAQSKESIENWIAERIKQCGLLDKEAALAMWRTQGIPQHYGPPVSRNGIYPITEGARPVTGLSALEPRTFLLPEQMFPERLFKNNDNSPPSSQSIHDVPKIIGSKSNMGSPVSANSPSLTSQLGVFNFTSPDSGLGLSDAS